MIVWDREDYLKWESKELEAKEFKLEVLNDSSTPASIIFKSLEEIKRAYLSQDTLVKDTKFVMSYILPKVHIRLYDVPTRLVISNCSFSTESIYSLFDFHLQSLIQKVKSYVKVTNHFLRIR